MQQLLVPSDFSANAMKAALYAAEIAKRNKAVVHLMHTVELGLDKIYQPPSLQEKYDRMVREDRMAELENLRQTLQGDYPGVQFEITVEYGTAPDSILDYCRYKAIDLVVMGTRGAGLIKEKLVGTVAASVVAHSLVPVLVVPDEYELEEPDGILFATSQFEKNKQWLNAIMTLARLFSATVHVVVFLDTDKAEAVDYLDTNRDINAYLRFLKKEYPDINFKGELVDGKEFEPAIEQYHNVNETDLAAMITYPKGFWERILKRSVTRKMVYHSGTPVLAIPAKSSLP